MLTTLKSGPRSAPARSSVKAPAMQSITQLYREFEAAHAVYFKMTQQYNELLKEAGLGREHLDALDVFEAGPILTAATAKLGAAWHKRYEAAANRCNKLARSIITAPATSLPEILLKLRAVAWGSSSDELRLDELDHHIGVVEETEASHILSSVQADLLRLTEVH